MTGRQEYEQRINAAIEKSIAGEPEILKDYYAFLSEHPATTKKQFVGIVKNYFDYLRDERGVAITDEYFNTVKPRDIIRWMEHIRYKVCSDGTKKELKEKTRRDKLIALNNFFKYLYINDYIDSNPCEKVDAPKVTEEFHTVALTEEEVAKTLKIIEAGEPAYKFRDAAIFALMFRTGLRATAVSNINVSDIDFEKKEIHVVEKGNNKRDIQIAADTIKKLQKWLSVRFDNGEINDALFTEWTRRGKYQRISQKEIARRLLIYTEWTGKHITPHKLRSTCATLTYEKTGDIFRVADTIGHANIRNTRRYIGNLKAARREVADVMDNIG